MAVVRLSSKGQIVLPREIRETLGLRKGAMLQAVLEDKRVILIPLSEKPDRDWKHWRGCLRSAQVLQDHLMEHAEEVLHERLS